MSHLLEKAQPAHTHLRAPYERGFAQRPKRVRYRGVAKNQFAAFLQTLTFNLKRLLVLELFKATPQFQEVPGSGSPSVKTPNRKRFVVKNIYADFKRHDFGSTYWERNFDGTLTKEFMIESLWGVGSGEWGVGSGEWGGPPRMDMTGGVSICGRPSCGTEAQKARDRFTRLPEVKPGQVIDFLPTLVLFPPDDTASNLNPGDSHAQNFLQYGHGNIAGPALFNIPSDLE